MFKRIIGYVLCGLTCANFGILSAVFPIFYMPLLALIDKGNLEASYASLILSALLCGIIAGLLFYLYTRKQRLNHEDIPVYLPAAFIGYMAGIVLIVIVLFLMSVNPEIAYN